jgi:hypothetical protein
VTRSCRCTKAQKPERPTHITEEAVASRFVRVFEAHGCSSQIRSPPVLDHICNNWIYTYWEARANLVAIAAAAWERACRGTFEKALGDVDSLMPMKLVGYAAAWKHARQKTDRRPNHLSWTLSDIFGSYWRLGTESKPEQPRGSQAKKAEIYPDIYPTRPNTINSRRALCA